MSPLSTLLWYFNLDRIAESKQNYEQLANSEDFAEVMKLYSFNLTRFPSAGGKPSIPI